MLNSIYHILLADLFIDFAILNSFIALIQVLYQQLLWLLLIYHIHFEVI
jgi:hypothetical protein